jgi:hypothetical protein
MSLQFILRTEGLIIIKVNYAWCMKLSLIIQAGRESNVEDVAYLRIEIVDPSDSGIDIASMDGLSYFYAGLDGLLFKRQLDVRFFGELLGSSGKAFADQVVHDDKVDVPVDVQLATLTSWLLVRLWMCTARQGRACVISLKLTCTPHMVSERFPTYFRRII